jgi:hypothetical protein
MNAWLNRGSSGFARATTGVRLSGITTRNTPAEKRPGRLEALDHRGRGLGEAQLHVAVPVHTRRKAGRRVEDQSHPAKIDLQLAPGLAIGHAHRGPPGTRVPGLRLGKARAHALLAALLVFRLHPHGFTNRDLRALTAELRGLRPDQVSAGQMTYDLRRLRTHGLIERIPRSHRYRVTDPGLHTAAFLTRIHDRLLPTSLAELTDSTHHGPLQAAATTYHKAIDTLTRGHGLAA